MLVRQPNEHPLLEAMRMSCDWCCSFMGYDLVKPEDIANRQYVCKPCLKDNYEE